MVLVFNYGFWHFGLPKAQRPFICSFKLFLRFPKKYFNDIGHLVIEIKTLDNMYDLKILTNLLIKCVLF